ncbi:MAG: pseudouridine synthase [Syntrophothermus sp.]
MIVRLNKYIADSGAASRRKADEYILQGRVNVNRDVVLDLGHKVDTEKDDIYLDGEKLHIQRHVYYLLNKPRGVVTTTDDEKNRATVIDLLKIKEKVFPVGRLDYNTTGVLFITNDGDFSYLLTHPKNNVPRQYEVKVERPINDEDVQKFLKGIYLQTGRAVFKTLTFPKKSDRKFVEVSCVEGRNHFVKNMFGALGYNVISLNRKSYAGITADIPVGSYRPLTPNEINKIKEIYAG